MSPEKRAEVLETAARHFRESYLQLEAESNTLSKQEFSQKALFLTFQALYIAGNEHEYLIDANTLLHFVTTCFRHNEATDSQLLAHTEEQILLLKLAIENAYFGPRYKFELP